jgi:hypothetical protein
MPEAEDQVLFVFVESKIFSKQVHEPGVEVLELIQCDLVQNPQRGAIVKGTHGVRKARVADPASSLERVAVIDICISILNTPAEFTCSTYSAKESNRTCRRSRSKSSER